MKNNCRLLSIPAERAILSGLGIVFPATVDISIRKTKHGGGTTALLATIRKGIEIKREDLKDFVGSNREIMDSCFRA